MVNFIRNSKNERANVGTYLLSFSLVLFSIIIGQTFSFGFAVNNLGFSLLNIPSSADKNVVLILLLIPFALAFLTLMACIKYIHKRKLHTLFTTRESFDWKRFFLSFSVWLFVLVIALLPYVFSHSEDLVFNFDAFNFITLFLISVFILPLQTSAEDLFFRGFIMQGLGKTKLPAWSIILTSGLAFGMLHAGNPEVIELGKMLIIFYCMTGVFLGLLTQLDGGLELGMGYHLANNFFASVIVTNNWQAFQTDALFIDYAVPNFGWESWLTIIVLQPLLIVIYSKIYKWKNIKLLLK